MGRVTHADTQRMMAYLLANRKEPYFTVTVQSASAPFNYSFTPYIPEGESFWVDHGDGNEETYTTASSTEKSYTYDAPGTYTIRMLGSAGINHVRIAPVNAGQAALVVNSNGNLDGLGTITVTDAMFYACPNLVMPELTGGITSIGTNAFFSCTSLALTSLPEDVTNIGNGAFYGCTGLTDLIFLGTPTSIASNAFGTSGANLFVPWSSGEVANAPWGAASVTYDHTP